MPCGYLEDTWYTFGKPELKRWVEFSVKPDDLISSHNI
jgi:hypothetical protein